MKYINEKIILISNNYWLFEHIDILRTQCVEISENDYEVKAMEIKKLKQKERIDVLKILIAYLAFK